MRSMMDEFPFLRIWGDKACLVSTGDGVGGVNIFAKVWGCGINIVFCSNKFCHVFLLHYGNVSSA